MLLFCSLFICRRNPFPSMSDHLIASEGVFTDFFTQQIDKFTGSLYTIRRNTAIGGEHCFPSSGLPLLKFRLIAGVFYVHVFKPASLPSPAFLSIISHFGHGLRLLCLPHFNAARPLTYRKSAGRSVILTGAYLQYLLCFSWQTL